MHQSVYSPSYRNSRAIVVGIDDYKHCGPLSYACSDGDAVAETLRTRFGFPPENVVLLKDKQATKAKISSAFLKLADQSEVEPDDRIVFFFAGHGHTATSRRGEVGFLVPVDGRIDDLSTMIRWDELTKNADMVPAKHMFFIMDACYGGLAAMRHLSPGSMRFLKDMLRRYSRQVLTAGKANEVVADSGGPRPGHSVFTGHLSMPLKVRLRPLTA